MLTSTSSGRFSSRISRPELAVLGALLVLFVVLCIGIVSHGFPLGHDEAVYSLKARHFAESLGDTNYFWRAYRAPGLSWILTLLWSNDPTEASLRGVVASFGVLLIVLTWAIGRELFGPLAALIAAGGLSLTPTILTASTQVWPDVPAATMGLLAAGILLWSSRHTRFTWWVLLAAPVAASATLIRYGAPLALVVSMPAIVLFRWRKAWVSIPQVTATALITMAGIASVLFLPFVTGSPGVPFEALASQSVGRDIPLSQGFIHYWDQREVISGGLFGVVLTVGLLLSLVLGVRHRFKEPSLIMIWGISILTLVAIAVGVRLGEPRYLSPIFPWVWTLAGAGIAAVLKSARPWALAAVGILMVVVVTPGVREQSEPGGQHRELREAALFIGEHATTDCGVITSYAPAVAWYSGCRTQFWSHSADVPDAPHLLYEHLPAGGDVYLLWVNEGTRQPERSLIEVYEERALDRVFMAGSPDLGRRRYVEVWQLADN